ncbi:25628_t:CDS:2, partial [Racocetra persica]
MTWSNATRVLIHIGDAPPHGRRFTNLYDDEYLDDDYPEGDPNGLTAESVLKKMQLKKILYYFGKINDFTDVMINVFREIIGELPIFDLMTTGHNPEALNNHPKKTGKLLYCILPKTLSEVKDEYYFINSNLIEQDISFKLAPQPFSVGAERYAYFALDTSFGQANKLVIKKYHDVKISTTERYLESVEISNIAYFFSTKFNIAAKRVGVNKKVRFINAKVLHDKADNTYYSIEKYIDNAEFKKFNVSSGLITEFHSILEAFAHFTYQYSEEYLVVYDLQGVELHDEFLLTDPAIHCIDLLRFGNTNLGKRGIQKCFLAKHKCNDI